MSMPTAGSASTPPPITVSITRSVDPDRVPEVTRWVQTGVNLANTWPGFLGSGWVRAHSSSTEWHMLYRFADASLLEAWETSPERQDWLLTGHGLVQETRTNKRTGIEGWFDAPSASTDLDTGTIEIQGVAVSTRPPRWKQSISIWLGFFPVNLAFTLLVTTLLPGWNDLNVALKVLVTTSLLTPVMAYWVLPFVTRMLQGWLVAPRR